MTRLCKYILAMLPLFVSPLLAIGDGAGAESGCLLQESQTPSATAVRLAKTVDEISKNQDLIPELLSNAVALTPSVLEHDSRQIARTLVARLARSRDQTTQESSSYYDFKNGTSIKMLFDQSILGNIISKGFLNSHQVPHASMNYNPSDMLNIESREIGMIISGYEAHSPKQASTLSEVLPKYAYLSMDNPNPRVWKSRLDKRYGDIAVVFKDEIKDRTTFTAGNSWSEAEKAHTLDYKTNHAFPEPDYAYLREGPVWGHQWEAQIWGALDLSDVSYFMVNCSGNKKITKENLQLLKTTGIPIYKCEVDSDNSRMDRGKKIGN